MELRLQKSDQEHTERNAFKCRCDPSAVNQSRVQSSGDGGNAAFAGSWNKAKSAISHVLHGEAKLHYSTGVLGAHSYPVQSREGQSGLAADLLPLFEFDQNQSCKQEPDQRGFWKDSSED